MTTPSGRVLTYKHELYSGPEDTDWLLTERSMSDGVVSSTAQWAYTDVPFVVNKPLKAVSQQQVSQDGVTYTTQFGYQSQFFHDYLRPSVITESASNFSETRVTTRAFDYNWGAYIVNRIGSQTVTVGGESFTTSAAYDGTGFARPDVRL